MPKWLNWLLRVIKAIPTPAPKPEPNPQPKPEPPPPPAPVPDSTAHFAVQLATLHGVQRSLKGIERLALDNKLCEVAQKHSDAMARARKVQHVIDGRDPGDRLRDAGVSGSSWGENVAGGFSDANAVMRAWLLSAGHKQNILNPDFTHAGFGLATDSAGMKYWTAVFLRKTFGVGVTLPMTGQMGGVVIYIEQSSQQESDAGDKVVEQAWPAATESRN